LVRSRKDIQKERSVSRIKEGREKNRNATNHGILNLESLSEDRSDEFGVERAEEGTPCGFWV
jgi:hypothetical protein